MDEGRWGTAVKTSADITCLLAKASSDESTKWHRRMAHVNFKNINKLEKHGLVNGLPSKLFTNDHNCVACNKGKQYMASSKAISSVSTISEASLSYFTWTFCHIKPLVHVDILNYQWTTWENFEEKLMKVLCWGLGQEWYFDLDYLTDSLGYTRFKSNQPVGPTVHKASGMVGGKSQRTLRQAHLFPTGNIDPAASISTSSIDPAASISTEMEDIYHHPSTGIFSSSSYDADFGGNVTNLAPIVTVDPVPTKRVNIIHPQSQILGDLTSPNKREDRGIVVRNKAILVAQGHRKEEGIDIDESAFLYGEIEKEVYVTQPKGFEDPHFPKHVYKVVKALSNVDDIFLGLQRRAWCDEFEVLMKGEFELSARGECEELQQNLMMLQSPLNTRMTDDAVNCVLALDSRYSDSDLLVHMVMKIHNWWMSVPGLRLNHGSVIRKTLWTTSSTEAEYVADANCCGQFWSTASLRAPELGPPAILATIDKTPYTITKDTIRSQLQLGDDGGDHMPLLVAMLPPAQAAIADEGAHELIFLTFFTSINVEDETLGGSFYTTPPRSTLVPPVGPTSRGAEDLATLTALSFLVSELVQKKVKALELKLKTRSRKVVMSESDKEEEEEQDVDPLIKLAKVVAASDAHVDISPGADIPPSPPLPTGMSAGVSSGVSTGIPAGTSNKGKSPIMEVDPPVKRRTFRQMEEDMLAKYYIDADWTDIMGQVHANQGLTFDLLGSDVNKDNFAERMVALIAERRRAFAAQSTSIYTTGWTMKHVKSLSDEQLKSEFEKIRTTVTDLQSQNIRRTLKRVGEDLEHDVSKNPKPAEVPMSSQPAVPQQQATNVPPGHTYGTRRKSLGTRKKSSTALDLDDDDRSFIRVLSDDDSDDDDDPVIFWSAFATWEVVPTPLGDINALYMMDRSSKYFTHLREILHLVDRQDLLKLYGMVVKYYEDHPLAGAGMMLWGDLQVLFESHEGGHGSLVWSDQQQWHIRSWRLFPFSNVHVLETISGKVVYMFADGSYPLSVQLMKKMLKHKLEIEIDGVGNDMTYAEQLIQFIKNQIAASIPSA
ncbi:anticodon-binding aminoacyl-tRNA synthetase, class 1a [Tanacetum coccineum]